MRLARAAIKNYGGYKDLIQLFFLKVEGEHPVPNIIRVCNDLDCDTCKVKYVLHKITSRGEPIYDEVEGAGAHG